MNLQTALENLASALGFTGIPQLAVVILVPMILIIVEHYIKRRIDTGQDKDIAKLKAQLDRTQQEMQALLDLKTHASREQFNVEFALYRDFWKRLTDIRQTLGIVAMLHEDTTPTDSKKVLLEEQKSKLLGAMHEFDLTIRENRPFYAQDVNAKLLEVSDWIHDEIVIPPSPGSSNTRADSVAWNFTENGVVQLDKLRDNAADAIRARLANVVIIQKLHSPTTPLSPITPPARPHRPAYPRFFKPGAIL